MHFRRSSPFRLYLPICLGFGLYPHADLQAQTLHEAVSQAIRGNQRGFSAPSVLSNRKGRLRIEKEYYRARSKLFPEVDFAMGRGREWTNSSNTRSAGEGGLALDRDEMSLTVKQRIFDGFETKYGLEKAEAELKANDFNEKWAEQDLTFRVVEAYLEVLKQRELLAMGNTRLLRHRDNLKKRREMAELGTGSEVEVQVAKSRLARVIPEHRDNLAALQTAEAAFTRLVGVEPGSLSRPPLPETLLPASLEVTLSRVLSSHPALLAARAELKGVQAEVALGRAEFWPKLDLELSMSETENTGGTRGATKNAKAMVQMEYNLFQGGFHLADLQLSKKKSVILQEELSQTRMEIIRLITDSWNAIQTSRSRILQLEKRAAISQELVNAYHSQFRMGLGARRIQDVWDAEDDLYQARRSVNQEQFQLMIQIYRLLGDMGILQQALMQPATMPKRRLRRPHILYRHILHYPSLDGRQWDQQPTPPPPERRQSVRADTEFTIATGRQPLSLPELNAETTASDYRKGLDDWEGRTVEAAEVALATERFVVASLERLVAEKPVPEPKPKQRDRVRFLVRRRMPEMETSARIGMPVGESPVFNDGAAVRSAAGNTDREPMPVVTPGQSVFVPAPLPRRLAEQPSELFDLLVDSSMEEMPETSNRPLQEVSGEKPGPVTEQLSQKPVPPGLPPVRHRHGEHNLPQGFIPEAVQTPPGPPMQRFEALEELQESFQVVQILGKKGRRQEEQ